MQKMYYNNNSGMYATKNTWLETMQNLEARTSEEALFELVQEGVLRQI